MMTLWMTLLACGDKAATDTADTTSTEDTAEDTSTEDTSTTTDEVRPPVRPFCKLMTSTGEYNGDTAFDNTFTWDGYTQSFEGEQNVYNEYGVIEYSYRAEEYEYEGETFTYFYEDTYEYECDGWCKMLSHVGEQGTIGAEIISTSTEYTWEGNKQNYGDGSRYWVYNDMGYVIEFYDGGQGYENTEESEYDCNDQWCKQISAFYTHRVDGADVEESFIEFTWDGNTQTWDENTKVYNDYGYTLEYTSIESLAQWYYKYTYDCE